MTSMTSSLVLETFELGLHWPTLDPFLFCAHHHEQYPPGNGRYGPAASLEGRDIGQDFAGKDGWRMYHGQHVPGFPGHPHRGFETVTLVRRGFVDHADSHGAAGRYGSGDVQWMTAGSGLQHSEMFPLLHEDTDNPLELFQVWLNLPAASKMTAPDFAMFWREQVPVVELQDAGGKVEVLAGNFAGTRALAPPAASWAAQPEAEVTMLLIELKTGGSVVLPAAPDCNRMLYCYEGGRLSIAEEEVQAGQGFRMTADAEAVITAEDQPAALLLLQGRPLEEPVAQYGPFVMNNQQELQQAFADYQATGFGGWPWPEHEQVHGDRQRFARYADGREEQPDSDL